ncbi:anti-sigma factor [Sphaerisporangium flaviroseum]|uniref:Anti-sigma factor n=1 Tax=Sphaerisporangium flaviroseum TaxID=509199 RepID=A0ABP7IKC4_9ACTN
MRHPTDGTLRRLLDEPDGVADADRQHIAGCPVCLSGMAAAQRDAAVTGAALSVDFAVDVDAGWHRLANAVAVEGRRPAATAAPAGRWLTKLRNPVVAILGVVVILSGAGVAAAADWLQIFRTEQVAPVTVPLADLVKIPELSAFGELKVTAKLDVRQVADAAAVHKATGLSVPQVSRLPRGVTGEPTYRVGGRVGAAFTFSVAETARTVTAAGGTPPPPPPGLDGSEFRLAAGPGLAAVWSQGRPAPALIVARAVAPVVYSSGVPFETARDYLLSLPNLPKNVAAQLRAFSGTGTTLPLFVSTERLTTTAAEVGGVPATVLTSRDGALAGVVWVDDGVVTAVAGSLSAEEVLSVARGLRWGR